MFRVLLVALLVRSLCDSHPVESDINRELNTYIEEESKHDDEVGNHSVVDEIIVINKRLKTKLFEADIKIDETPEAIRAQYSKPRSNLLKRGLRRLQEYLWIDRVIPYEVTEDLASSKPLIKTALDEIARQSCLEFVPYDKQNNWVKFVDRGACYSGVGRTFWREGSQVISLGKGCLKKGTIMHEMLHALGFWHEQSRPDRDQYIEIFWENIEDGEESNFAKYSTTESNSLKSAYDMSSIMHYGRTSFSKNGKPTILAIGDKKKQLGQRDHLSEEDAIQLNLLYQCKDIGKIYSSWTEWSPCSPDFKCEINRQRFCSNYNEKKCPLANQFGIQTEFKTCPKEECNRPRDGHWNKWSPWSACNKECGRGTKKRIKKCDDPKPINGGEECTGYPVSLADCYIKPCGLGPDDCLFDGQEMCFWKDTSPEYYSWQRIKGPTPSGNTGPDGDHSNGKSYYLYTESSAPTKLDMKANLVSKVFPATSGRCMTFFYSMHGLSIGKLKVYHVSERTGKETILWEKTGPQGAGWKEGVVEIVSNRNYKIKFQAVRGRSYLGDIGLDDVHFAEMSCSDKQVLPEKTITEAPVAVTPAEKVDGISKVCATKVKPLGCFADIPHNRAIPNLLDSHRPGGPAYHGAEISWKDYTNSLNRLFCECIQRARDRGFRYIGLQYFAECYGVNDTPKYNRYGISTLCINGKYEPCYHGNKNEVCMGKQQTNYVYEIL